MRTPGANRPDEHDLRELDRIMKELEPLFTV